MAKTYRVTYGDSLYQIARRHGTTVNAIIAANKHINPYDLRVGDMITIPESSAAFPATHQPSAGVDYSKEFDKFPAEDCPKSNMLRNPGFERWSGSNPDAWYSQNVSPTNVAHDKSYAAELGRTKNLQALLSQRLKAAPRHNYRITFWARENAGQVSRFTLEIQIYIYNAAGKLIGRVDPVYTMENIPNRTYQQFSFTSGVLPAGTSEMEVRFVFRPKTNNRSSVKIDDVEVICVGKIS